MKFIADENIPLKVVERLREANVDIKAVVDIKSGLEDEEIVKISKKEKSIIITFDKDFGEIVFRKKLRPFGVILLRFSPKSVDHIFDFLRWVIKESEIEFKEKLVVVREDRIREIKIS